MPENNSKEYKPYTTPYTGAGAVKTEQGWVNSRDLGAPGAASGPGKRRDSGPPVPPFHHTELTSANVAPPPGHESLENTGGRSARGSVSSNARSSRSGSINLHGENQDIKAIKGPGGVGFDLPKHHKDLDNMSNREIALKIGLLNIKKGSIHEALHQAATNREILSCDPQEQLKLRNDNARQLSEVEEAIRAWEAVQANRAENISNPGLVDMLMISQDYYHDEQPKGQHSTPDKGSSSSDHCLDGKKKKRRGTNS
ncbi:hypothetical protein HD806DRAFT_524735 [Xylariaceae sp. AK1471]|nr:hypothetical protein HD806DRAFT_524735 [Xylariaceae sp. AK1471]